MIPVLEVVATSSMRAVDFLYPDSQSKVVVIGETTHSIVVKTPAGSHWRLTVPAGLMKELVPNPPES